MRNLIMVTPARDEEDFLKRVVDAVVQSSVRPRLWVIVDDNSEDETSEIARQAISEHDFIRLIRLDDSSPRDIAYRYSYVCALGFEYCISIADDMGLQWQYMGLLDADTLVEQTYFEKLIDKLAIDPSVGLASGNVHVFANNRTRRVRAFPDKPSGTARIWRKECFLETGGYGRSQAPDSVSTVKARLRGWGTARYCDITAYQLRETSSASGSWKGYVERGRATHFLDCHPLLVIGRAGSYAIQRRFYLVLAYFAGYLSAVLKKEEKIDDGDVRAYYRIMRIRELVNRRYR